VNSHTPCEETRTWSRLARLVAPGLLAGPLCPAQKLKRLLQHTKTRSYFDGNGWTDNPKEAKCFPNISEAVWACIDHDLKDVELVLRDEVDGQNMFSKTIR
jgi:hypothetical protein